MSDHPAESKPTVSMRTKLARLRDLGVEPFALGFPRPSSAQRISTKFGWVPAGQEDSTRVRVAGRIRQIRAHGQLVFATLQDASGPIQLVFEDSFLLQRTPRAIRRRAMELTDLFDIGDLVGAEGHPVRTRRGELSVKVRKLTLLTKALRPLPEKWHGLQDPELQQRLRHVHLITDPAARRNVTARARTLHAFRELLDGRGFVEVETPVLQPVAGGAMARPFVTHHRVLDVNLYLRISLELYLKRLLVGGLERVYEIGRNFRNEGIDRSHNPEFTMLEVYQAYGDYTSMMELTESLVRAAAVAVNGSATIAYRGQELDLAAWKRVTLLGSVSEAVGEEVTLDRKDLANLAESQEVNVDPRWPPGKLALEMFEKLAAPGLIQPTFVMDFPREVSPLARPHRSDPRLTEHMDPYIGGLEIGTGYSELTDPIEQRAKFELQQQARLAGDEEAHPYDEDFIEALEYGMPPAGGLGIGVDRLLMILTDAPSLRDLILFPHMRPEPGRG